jgi:hypothetical protein
MSSIVTGRNMELGRRSPTFLAVVLASTVAYGALLGWDQDKDVDPNGGLTGPYQAWQVVLLAVVLAGAAVLVGWEQTPWIAAVAATVAMTVCFSVDAATDPPATNDGLWPVGAFLVAIGTYLGMAAIGLCALAAKKAWIEARRGRLELARSGDQP